MDHGEPESELGTYGRQGRFSTPWWRFCLILLVVFLITAYVLLWHGIGLYEKIAANLPLLLPLVVTILSVFTRVADIRNYEAVLKMSNDIAIGIISFDIWAISASRSNPAGRVLVNEKMMIRGDFVLPFLLLGLLIAVGCVVLTHYNFREEPTKHRWLLIALVTSILMYVAPFGVLERIPTSEPPASARAEIRKYTVIIPYQDPGIISYAPTVLRNRVLVRFEKDVEATSYASAQAIGVKLFLDEPESDQVRSKSRNGDKVVIRNQEVLAVEK